MARMAGFILIAGGFCISIMQAYIFGRARGEMGSASSDDFLRLLHSVQNNAAVAFVGGIVIFVIGHLIVYRSSNRNP
jgi:hypothetical protein